MEKLVVLLLGLSLFTTISTQNVISWSPCATKSPTAETQPSTSMQNIVSSFQQKLKNNDVFMLKELDSIYSHQKTHESKQSTLAALCAQMSAPLHYQSGTLNRNITLFAKKFPSRIPSQRIGQLWLLQGGPGARFVVERLYKFQLN